MSHSESDHLLQSCTALRFGVRPSLPSYFQFPATSAFHHMKKQTIHVMVSNFLCVPVPEQKECSFSRHGVEVNFRATEYSVLEGLTRIIESGLSEWPIWGWNPQPFIPCSDQLSSSHNHLVNSGEAEAL